MTSSKEISLIVRRTYNAVAEHYIKAYPFMSYKPFLDRFLSKLRPHSRIVDLGCGSGRASKYISDAGHDIVGIDLSPVMIGLAHKNAPAGRFRVMSLQELSFSTAYFDAGIALFSLVHLPSNELPGVMQKIRRTIKREGYLLVSVVRGNGGGLCQEPLDRKRIMFFRGFSRFEITEALTKAKFKILTVETSYAKTEFGTEPDLWILCQAA